MAAPSVDCLIIGCGYLGQRVARTWMSEGRRVAALTRSPARAAEWSQQGLLGIVGDICQPATLTQLPAARTVLYCVGYDAGAGVPADQVAHAGLQHVLQQLTRSGGPSPERWLYVSSTSVYGQADGSWVDENSPCESQQPSGQRVLAAERLLRAACPQAIILRFAGIYGPDRLLAKVTTLRESQPLPGSPEAWLNLIHVDDGVTAVLAAAERGESGRTYLVADDEPVRRGEYYAELAKLCAAPPPSFDTAVAARHGSSGLNKRCQNTRLRQELGVTLKYPNYRVGLAATWSERDSV